MVVLESGLDMNNVVVHSAKFLETGLLGTSRPSLKSRFSGQRKGYSCLVLAGSISKQDYRVEVLMS